MAYPICKIKNIDTSSISLQGRVLAVNEVYAIPDIDRVVWANDDEVITAITGDIAQIGDSDTWLEGYAEQIAHLQKY